MSNSDENPFLKLSKNLKAIQGLSGQMDTVDTLYDGNKKLWEAAIRMFDGKAESEYRAKMHTLLDQKLDLYAQVLQLAKEFQS